MEGFFVTISEAACLAVSLALSGFSFYVYKKRRTIIDKINNAPRLTIDKKLNDILKATPGACLEYVIIEGAVKPAGRSLISWYNKENVGVVRKFMVKEHRLLWNIYLRRWTDNERLLHENVEAVPFLLVGLDNTQVRVLSPLQATGLDMEVTYEKFQQVSHSLGELMGQYLSGEKPKGQLEIEEMLKVGTNLTGVGELNVDTDGTLSLRPPCNGSEYFLTTADFEALQGKNENVAFWWKVLAITSALAGAAVIFWAGLRYYRHLQARLARERERIEFNRLVAEAASLQNNLPEQENLEDTQDLCVICRSRPRNCVLLDCGHVCCCYTCYQALPQRCCPMCRQSIVRVLPVYHA